MSKSRKFTHKPLIIALLPSFALSLGIIIWLTNSSFAAPPPEVKFGYVDLQEALIQSEAGKKAFAALKEEFKKKEQDVRQKEEELKELQSEMTKQGAILSESAKREKEDNYRRLLKDYKRYVNDSEQELQTREKEYTEKILKEIIDVIQKFGKQKGYTMIWEKKGIIYAPEKVDLTNDILKIYDANMK